MSAKDKEAKDDELLALSSIFDDNVLDVNRKYYSGTFKVHVQMNGRKTLKIAARTRIAGKDVAEYELQEHEVSNLPPMTLNFRLPYLYPSKRPPRFHMSCCWLNLKQLSMLCQELDDLWRRNRGEVILFTWIQFLQDETLAHLQINETLDLNVIFPIRGHNNRASHYAKRVDHTNNGSEDSHSSKQPRVFVRRDPRKASSYRGRQIHCTFNKKRTFVTSQSIEECLSKILDYDKRCKMEAFETAIFLCEVCFSQYMGNECISFEECQHVFCKSCVNNYFEELVKQGQVGSLSCLADGCSTRATIPQIQRVLSKECFARYDHLLLAATLDSMGDIIYCARKDCQSPVIKEPDGNVAICPTCKFAFCIYCRMSSHGVELCRFKEGEDRKLFEEYSTGSEETKRALERRYGKRQMSHLVDTTLANSWVKQNTKPCPRCKSPIEKQSGCNKMVCWHCQSCFCWICMEVIQDRNPYRHFNVAASSCFGLLFQGAEFEEDDDVDDEIFGDDNDDEDNDDEDEDEYFWNMVVGALADVMVV